MEKFDYSCSFQASDIEETMDLLCAVVNDEKQPLRTRQLFCGLVGELDQIWCGRYSKILTPQATKKHTGKAILSSRYSMDFDIVRLLSIDVVEGLRNAGMGRTKAISEVASWFEEAGWPLAVETLREWGKDRTRLVINRSVPDQYQPDDTEKFSIEAEGLGTEADALALARSKYKPEIISAVQAEIEDGGEKAKDTPDA